MSGVEWIPRPRKKIEMPEWLRAHGLGLAALLFLAALLLYLRGLESVQKFIMPPKDPIGYAEISGRILRLDTRGNAFYALLDREDGKSVQYIFYKNEQTQFLRENENTYEWGKEGDIKVGTHIVVYLQKHLSEDPWHYANAIVYQR